MEVGAIGQTRAPGADKAKTLLLLYEMLDAPVAIVQHVDENSQHAVRIRKKESAERDRAVSEAEGMDSQ